MKRKVAGLTLCLMMAGPASADCLNDVADFAIRICGEIAKSGAKTTVTADGKLDANISSIISRIVGGGTASASGSVTRETFENLAQKDLPTALADNYGCRNTMVAVAVSRVCQKAVKYRVCENPAFGQRGWANSVIAEGNSGWMSGGHTEPEWCTNLANTTIGSRHIGAHQVTILEANHGERWSGIRHRQYNFHCKLKIDYVPIFNSRRDALCGVEPE